MDSNSTYGRNSILTNPKARVTLCTERSDTIRSNMSTTINSKKSDRRSKFKDRSRSKGKSITKPFRQIFKFL